MKKKFQRNQLIITGLALLIAVAGYFSFASRKDAMDLSETEAALADESVLESMKDESIDDKAISDPLTDELNIADMDDQDIDPETVGEAVLTSSDQVSGLSIDQNMANAKLTKEQVRAKEKESLLAIIENESLSDDQKKDAVSQMLTLTDNMEKEANAMQQLEAKGFRNAIVSISDNAVDVLIGAESISETEKAQIEDVVTRKTGCTIKDIYITTVK